MAASLRDCQALGITHFILSDTPYLPELVRQGDRLLPPLRREPAEGVTQAEGRRRRSAGGISSTSSARAQARACAANQSIRASLMTSGVERTASA